MKIILETKTEDGQELNIEINKEEQTVTFLSVSKATGKGQRIEISGETLHQLWTML